MNISQRLRTCAKHTGLDSVIELLQEAADEIDAQQARAQVTQAEVPDAGIEQVLTLAHSYADAKLMRYGALGIKEPPDPAAAFSELRRAILALRPERVPMTEVWIDSAMCLADAYADACFDQGLNQRTEDPNPEAKREKLFEHLRHHGITAQAKKETP